MSAVHFNLANAATMGAMAPAPLAGGAFTNAALPGGLAGAGIYVIVNSHTHHRYVGISTDLAGRFRPRLATVTELGFSQAQMNRIDVFWGTVTTQQTAPPPAAAVPGAPVFPPVIPPVVPVAGYGAPLNVVIDGQVIQLERLLIRLVLTQLGAGGTVSNVLLAYAPYVNPTANLMNVRFTWGATANFAGNSVQFGWMPGGPAW